VPLIVALIVGITYLAVSMEYDSTPIGYVDHSGMLANPVPRPPAAIRWRSAPTR
jgi:hypothetical protein